MEEQKGKYNDIELRSEKVRNIIGQIPPLLVRSGIGVIALVVILVLVVCYYIPYSETIDGQIKIYSIPESEVFISPKQGVVYFETDKSVINKGDAIGYIQSVDTLIHLVAGISGSLSLNTKQDESVERGEILYAITPVSISTIYGRLLLPYEYKARIQTGQQVRIELMGFSSNEYGVLQGTVGKIYPLPVSGANITTISDSITPNSERQFLKVDVYLPNGLITLNRKELPFTPEMQGTTTVVLSQKRLLLKLFEK
jgi:hypothetical protein